MKREMAYFRLLGATPDEALKHIEDYKRGHPDLTDRQKEALDEIILFIKERRFCTDGLLQHRNSTVHTWAPSYGKDGGR